MLFEKRAYYKTHNFHSIKRKPLLLSLKIKTNILFWDKFTNFMLYFCFYLKKKGGDDLARN